MAAHHRLTNHDYILQTADCAICGPTEMRAKGNKWRCQTKTRKAYRRKYQKLQYGDYTKLDHCERCNFVAEHPCQLDVDHIDGNSRNQDHENLQTLCANCHRLKTLRNQDWCRKGVIFEDRPILQPLSMPVGYGPYNAAYGRYWDQEGVPAD